MEKIAYVNEDSDKKKEQTSVIFILKMMKLEKKIPLVTYYV